MCKFCKTQHSFTLYLLFCIFFLYCTDPQVEVQIRIILKDKYVKLCQNANTGNHTMISCTQFLRKFFLVFFILQKQLTNQGIFLMRSELSITVYLSLASYGSTTLQSQSFLQNLKKFLCKYKIVNKRSIPSMHAKRKFTDLSD